MTRPYRNTPTTYLTSLLSDPERLNKYYWTVSVLRKKTKEHSFIILRGCCSETNFIAQRIILCFDFLQVQQNRDKFGEIFGLYMVNIYGDGLIRLRVMCADDYKILKEKCEYQYWSLTAENTVNLLCELTSELERNDHVYNISGGHPSSGEKMENCASWIIRILKGIDIHVGNKWYPIKFPSSLIENSAVSGPIEYYEFFAAGDNTRSNPKDTEIPAKPVRRENLKPMLKWNNHAEILGLGRPIHVRPLDYTYIHLCESFYKIFQEHYRNFLNTPTNVPHLFIPPEGLEECNDYNKIADLQSMLQISIETLTDSILVIGDSGTGKTSLAKNISNEYWKVNQISRINGDSTFIPIYIHLPHVLQKKEDPNSKFVLEKFIESNFNHFQFDSSLDKERTARNVVDKLKHYKLILFLDGYDELGICQNLWELNDWESVDWKQIKVITFSRPEIFKNKLEQQNNFTYTKCSIKHFAKEYFICPYTIAQIDEYVTQFVVYLQELRGIIDTLPESIYQQNWKMVKNVTEGTDWEMNDAKYKYWLSSKIPELEALGKSPFLLTVILQILPRIVQKYEVELNSPNMNDKLRHIYTEVGIYDEFTEQWFEFQNEKIVSRQEPKGLYEIQGELTNYYRIYAQNLATYIVERGNGFNLFEGLSEEETLQPFLSESVCPEFIIKFKNLEKCQIFFQNSNSKTKSEADIQSQKENLEALRKGCLLSVIRSLKETGENKFVFLHHSLIEYFASREIFIEFILAFKYYVRQNSFISTEYLKFNQTSIETLNPKILSFLIDRAKNDEEFENFLNEIILKSGEVKQIRQMAANAITLLNLAGKCLSGKQFSNVQICGANLSNSILSNADFSFANLESVKFQHACIVNAKFQGANLNSVSFGQTPFIIHSDTEFQNPFIIFNYKYDKQEFLCCSYAQGNIVQNNLAHFTVKNEIFQAADFKDGINGKVLNFIAKGRMVGYKNDKIMIYFWDLDTKTIVDSIPDINVVFEEEYAKRDWKVLTRDVFKNLTITNVVDKNVDVLKGVEKDSFIWNIPERQLIVYIKPGKCHYTLSVFPCCMETLVNLEILNIDESRISNRGCRIVEFNRTCLISLLCSTRIILLRCDDRTGVCILPHINALNLTDSFEFSKNLMYFVYSTKKSLGEFILGRMNDEMSDFELEHVNEAKLQKGNAFDLQRFCFNDGSTMLGSYYDYSAVINIWSIEPFAKLRILYKIGDIAGFHRLDTNPQFCFVRNDTALAYYSSTSEIKISVVDLEELSQRIEYNSPSMDYGDLKTLTFSKDFKTAAVCFTKHLKIFHVPMYQNTMPISEFEFESEISHTVFVMDKNQMNHLLVLTTDGQLILLCVQGHVLTSAVISNNEEETSQPTRHSFSGPFFTEVRQLNSNFVLDLYMLNVEPTLSVTQLQRFPIKRVQSRIKIDHEGQFLFVVQVQNIKRQVLIYDNINTPFAGKLLQTLKLKCLGTFDTLFRLKFCRQSGKTCTLFCYTLRNVFMFELMGQKFRLKATIKLPHFQAPTLYNRLHYNDTINRVVLVSCNGSVLLIDPSTPHKIKSHFETWLTARLRLNSKFNHQTEKLELFVWDEDANLVCLSLSGKDFEECEIIWTNTPCSSLVCLQSNFEKCFNLSVQNQIVIKQSEGSSNSCIFSAIDKRKYTPLVDLLQGIKDEPPGTSMKPILSQGNHSVGEISADKWLLSAIVLKNRTTFDFGRNNHMALVLEGIKNSRRFVFKTELTFVRPNDQAPKQVLIKAVPIIKSNEFKVLAKTYDCASFKISSESGLKLLTSIQNDQISDNLKYNFFRNNCVKWCKDKLKVAGVQLPNRWYEIVIVPPHSVIF